MIEDTTNKKHQALVQGLIRQSLTEDIIKQGDTVVAQWLIRRARLAGISLTINRKGGLSVNFTGSGRPTTMLSLIAEHQPAVVKYLAAEQQVKNEALL